MKKFLSFSILCLTLNINAQDNRIILKLKQGQEITTDALKSKRTGISAIDAVTANYNNTDIKKLRTGKKSGQNVFAVTFASGANSDEIIRQYINTGLIEYAESDIQGSGGGMINNTPNDTYYNRQWSLKNDGSFSMAPAVAGADIDMENAWGIQQGSSDIIVAVIDSGMKLDHPEFEGRIWTNTLEVPNNGIDDDNNGYIDDIFSWNYAYENSMPVDDYGHGTNVAGIIGANGNNNVGYTGIDRNCKLMSLKALDGDNFGYYTWWAEAMYYAVDNGAKVINMSLGGSSSSQLLNDAVMYANQNNVTVVVCMMNNNTLQPYYPAAINNVIAVGATNPDDTRSAPFFWDANSGSNYGSHISVIAPGNYMYGLSHLFDSDFNTYWGGTSQAAPHVAGVASLLLAQNPTLTPAEIKDIIENTADDQIGIPAEDVAGYDIYYGHGRLNAFKALSQSLSVSKYNQDDINNFTAFPNPSNGDVTIKINNFPANVSIYNNLGQIILNKQINSDTENIQLTTSGMYFINVSNKSGVSSKKIIIK